MTNHSHPPPPPRRARGGRRLSASPDDPISGVAFTTEAFVGRIDTAVSLSKKPQHPPAEMKTAWEQARSLPSDGWEENMRKQVKAAWDGTDRRTLQAIGVAAGAATVLAAACFTLGCFQAVRVHRLLNRDVYRFAFRLFFLSFTYSIISFVFHFERVSSFCHLRADRRGSRCSLRKSAMKQSHRPR